MNRHFERLRNLLTLPTRPKPAVGSTPADAVWAEGKWRLLHYRRQAPATHRTPVVLVPSLINRHYVLDLMPGKSFVEFLLGQGFEVFAVDWGTPGPEDRHVTFDDVCERWLGRAIRKAAATGPDDKVHVLGYCMGGTLAAIHAAVHPEHVASLVTLAAPVRFDQGGILSAWTRSPGFDVRALVDGFGLVPWQLMQGSFQLLRPTLGLAKAVNLVDRAWNDRYLDGYLALETWANDNVSLPGEFYVRYIEALYQRDELVRGELTLAGRPVRLGDLRCPLLCVAFEDDGIAPLGSCTPLHELAGGNDKHLLRVPGSHVGGVVSREAAKGLWPYLAGFWGMRDGSVAGAGAGTAAENGAGTAAGPAAPSAGRAGARPPPRSAGAEDETAKTSRKVGRIKGEQPRPS